MIGPAGLKKVMTWHGDYIWIRKNRHGLYLPYSTWIDGCLNRTSPSLAHQYSQFSLQQAYETGIVISK